MAPRYMSNLVKLLLTLRVLLMFLISTASTEQSTSEKTERVIRNIGIKLCHLNCAEHGECASINCDIKTLQCHLLREEPKVEKKEHVVLAKSHSHDPADSSTSVTCSVGQRCLKTCSGKEVCVQASTDPKPNTVSPAPVTTQDSDSKVSTTDANEDLTPCKTVPAAPVTTQNYDPLATPSPADRRLYITSVSGNLERVKRILDAGHVDINTRGGRRSRTPVMMAARNGHSDVVEFLVCRGADVSLVDGDSNNILHLACTGGDLKTVKLILSLNVVDINARSNNGWTAATWARVRGHQRVADLLVSRGAH